MAACGEGGVLMLLVGLSGSGCRKISRGDFGRGRFYRFARFNVGDELKINFWHDVVRGSKLEGIIPGVV